MNVLPYRTRHRHLRKNNRALHEMLFRRFSEYYQSDEAIADGTTDHSYGKF
jgi:hypothetical protein